MPKPGESVWFHDRSGTYNGIVEKVNRDTINIIVEDSSRPEGYQLWRVTEYFLSPTPEIAIERFNDYRNRLAEFKVAITNRRIMYEYRKGMQVLVKNLSNELYTGTILEVDRITLILYTSENKIKRVDKAICMPAEYHGWG